MTTANGKAISTKAAFRMECAVSTTINAKAEKIWTLLTNAAGYKHWNSTIVSLEGTIAIGEKIKLKSTLDPKRTFALKVTEMTANSKMVWASGAAPMFKGVRTYTITQKADGTCIFTMAEVFTGIMLPMIKGSLPDFRPNFEQWAADLKAAAEKM